MWAKPLSLAAALSAGLLLSSCGSGGADGPGSVSVEEAQALDEAAEMLDERRLPDGVVSSAPPVQEAAQSENAGEDTGE